jgi:uncharacterized protein (TIGR02145 family)
MKKITTFLGCVGVVCLFWGCSSDSDILTPSATLAEEPTLSSASGPNSETLSSAISPATSSSSIGSITPNPTSSSGEVKHDTLTKQVIVRKGADSVIVPYPSDSPTFCWTDECKANPPEFVSSSSALVIDIGMSVEAQDPPTVSGNTMTDNRDGSTYKLQTVAGKLWMAENIKYKTSSGLFCDDGNGKDVCATYGGFYTSAAAQRACPGEWRLPTPAEVVAANDVVGHDWWTVGGRFKVSSSGESEGYGLEKEQGYLWLESDGENNAWRIEDYSEKKLEELASAADRAFNVRCVKAD